MVRSSTDTEATPMRLDTSIYHLPLERKGLFCLLYSGDCPQHCRTALAVNVLMVRALLSWQVRSAPVRNSICLCFNLKYLRSLLIILLQKEIDQSALNGKPHDHCSVKLSAQASP